MAAFRLRARPRPCVAVAAVAAVAAAAAAFAAPSAAEQPRRSSVLASLGGLGAMGWAGWLGSEMKPSTEGQYEEAVVGLGLGAPDVEDASGWELIFFQKTLEDIGHRCPRNSQVLYHYTDLPSCNAIVKGRRGLRLSRGGYKGGGVFFSKRSPMQDLPVSNRLWREIFPNWRTEQLRSNYGEALAKGREDKVDAVLVCYVPSSMWEEVDVDERKDTAFISLEKFETFAAEYFAYRNIPRAYRLAG
ncbi:unnamed protein product [Durusdinium trenchii]|uniref:Uncharacterized protein n=2 Tax=Durusdinium trenchii TaxID=1381693 RepID=A0ABP0I3E1_9DINO